MRIEHLSVAIKIEKIDLQEFDTKVRVASGAVKESACFVASEVEQSFAIRIKNQTKDAYSIRVFVDGRLVARRSLSEGERSTVKGARTSRNTQLPFKFSSLLLTDDENSSRPSDALLQELGSIRVEGRRIIIISDNHSVTSSDWHKHYDSITAVPEKSKKLGSHCVKFGDPIPCRPLVPVIRTYIDPQEGEPYCQFIFKYRPKELLQAQGILPLVQPDATANRPDQTVRTKRKQQKAEDERRVKPKTEDAVELESLLAEQEALEGRIREIRARDVKREPSPIVLKFPKGEIIDLTSD